MFKKHKMILLQFCVMFLAILSCGYHSCDDVEKEILTDPDMWSKTQEPAKNVVSIHKIIKYRRGEGVERTIKSYFEDDVCINRIQELDSSEIKSIEAVPMQDEDSSYNLKLNLTERGVKYWIALSIESKGTNLAFVVDGMLYRRFKPRLIYDDETTSVIVDGPFDRATAMGIQNQSKLNYYKMRK